MDSLRIRAAAPLHSHGLGGRDLSRRTDAFVCPAGEPGGARTATAPVTRASTHEDLLTLFLTFGTAGTLVGVAFTKLAERHLGGKKWAYIHLTVAIAVVGAGFYVVDVSHLWLLFAVHVLASLLSGPLMPLFWSMIADTADFAEWRFGRRFTGLVFSAGTFSQKSGWALGSAIAGWFLAWYGYEANVEQAPDTIEGIKQLMSFMPGLIGLLSAGAVLLYGIDAKLQAQIEAELKTRATSA